MSVQVVVTITGPETIGMLENIAAKTHNAGGHWLENQAIQLEGRTAWIIKVEVPEVHCKALQQDFQALAECQVLFSVTKDSATDHDQLIKLSFDSQDRPGLIPDIAHALTRQNIRLVNMESKRIGVTELGLDMFTAEMKLLVPKQIELDAIGAELEKLSKNTVVKTEMLDY